MNYSDRSQSEPTPEYIELVKKVLGQAAADTISNSGYRFLSGLSDYERLEMQGPRVGKESVKTGSHTPSGRLFP